MSACFTNIEANSDKKDCIPLERIQLSSYDFRASLATIRLCIEVAIDDLGDTASEKALELLVRALDRTRNLDLVIRDIVTLYRVRSVSESLKNPVSLGVVIEKAIQRLAEQIQSKRLQINNQVEHLFLVLGCDNTLTEMFEHILANAVQYTPPQGTIQIKSKADEVKNHIQVVVADNGIGIPEKEQSLVFSDFYRAKNAQIFEKNGTGLGLSIVQQIIDSHNGIIWLESQKGKGSQFFITLPKVM